MPHHPAISPLTRALLLSLCLHSLLLWGIWPAHKEYLAAGNNMSITLLRNARQNTPQDKPASAYALQPEDASQMPVIHRTGPGSISQQLRQNKPTSSQPPEKQSATHLSQSESHNQANNTEQRAAIQNPQSEFNAAVHITPGQQLPTYAQQVLLHIIDKASAGPRDGNLTVRMRLIPIGFATQVEIAQSSGDPELDNWMLRQILAANPFPAFPNGDTDAEKTLLIPIHIQWAH